MLLGLLLVNAAAADTPAEQASVEESPEERLEEAIRTYLSGELAEARNQLVVLVHDDEISDPALLEEARVWLGEVHYLLGDTAAAEAVFRTAIYQNPDLSLDTFNHPPQVVAFFDSVKAEIGRLPVPIEVPDPPVVVTNPTFIHWALPGGLQFYNEQPGWGAAALTGVSLSAISTLGINLYLRGFDDLPEQFGVQLTGHANHEEPESIQRLQRIRAAQWSVAGLGLVGWTASVAVGTAQRPRTETLSLAVGPSTVAVSFRF